jgi:DNA-binding LytR/AlgR family response regulator
VSTASWIFCEPRGNWMVACRRALTASPSKETIRLIETRNVAECRQKIANSPGAFVTIELTAECCDEALQLMMDLLRWHADVAFAVTAERAWRNYEPLVRELGAVHFVVSPRQVQPLAAMAARHLSRWSESEQTVPERTLARLPWGE